jgi:hypothetical protein
MLPVQNDLSVAFLKSLALATGATATSQTIDCRGYDAASLVFEVNGGAGTALAPRTLTIQHSDTDAATAFSDITGYAFTTSTTAWPTAVTAATSSTNCFARVNLDLRDKRRFIRALVGGNNVGTGVTVNISGIAILSRASESPTGTNTGAQFVANP